jgi:hypothetical protein
MSLGRHQVISGKLHGNSSVHWLQLICDRYRNKRFIFIPPLYQFGGRHVGPVLERVSSPSEKGVFFLRKTTPGQMTCIT